MSRCPFCGQDVRSGAKFCSHCGRSVTTVVAQPHIVAQTTCPHCGAPARSTAKFCPQCGMSLRETMPAGTPPLEQTLPGSPAPPAPQAAPGAQRRTQAPVKHRSRQRWLVITVLIVVALLLGFLFFWPDDTPVTPGVPTPNIAATLTVNAVTPTAPGDVASVDK